MGSTWCRQSGGQSAVQHRSAAGLRAPIPGERRRGVRCGAGPSGSPKRRPCQNYLVTNGSGSLAEALADELTACRQRGIERLDVRSHNQSPVQTPELQRLASEYVIAKSLHAHSRIAQLKYLLRDVIKALALENTGDAELIRDLFFGDSLNRVTKSAGELLDTARKKFGYGNEMRFREARGDALRNLANFIPDFVAEARLGHEKAKAATKGSVADVTVLPQLHANSNDSVPDPEVQQRNATTGYVDDGEHFIRLLAEATRVTIVGFTNEKLASMLRTALERKRTVARKPDACWDSLRIVFFSAKLLGFLDEEPLQSPYPDEVLRERHRAADYGRRSVNVFLRSLPAGRGAVYETPYFPPLVGTLFEMPDGHRMVQLIIRRRQPDILYVELEDTRSHYFSAAFEEIIHVSTNDNKVIPFGRPVADRFQVTSVRYRQKVLKDGSLETGWLALVLIITWRMRDGLAEALLQLRTQRNAARELDRMSHLSGHILQDDLAATTDFGLTDEGPIAAGQRRLQMEIGDESPAELKPLRTCRYFHPDKEHLFFFIYTCRLPDSLQLMRQTEMYAMSVQELWDIRANQVLRATLLLCESPPTRESVRAAAFEIASLNLVLHDYAEIAQKLTIAAKRGTAQIGRVAAEILGLEEQTRRTWSGLEEEVQVVGLSGLQHREFFTILLPLYASVGVPGSADRLMIISSDQRKRAAMERLSELYHDEGLMQVIPLEL